MHFKCNPALNLPSPAAGFNSLRAGKCISSDRFVEVSPDLFQFQFPPSGKVHFKILVRCQRLSPSLCFNSLRAGKCISSLRMFSVLQFYCWQVSIPSERESAFQVLQQRLISVEDKLFQFPPSGKVHFKELYWGELEILKHGFNSLRAGKCISRESGRLGYGNTQLRRFNSLRAGKCISRQRKLSRKRQMLHVSIPSERESAFQVDARYADQKERLVGFNSLRAGKCISRAYWEAQREPPTKRFNSLRAGKCISRLNAMVENGR